MTKTTRGLGCLVLFALPFALAGLAVIFLAGLMLWSWVEARDWQEAPARLLDVELEQNTGDDSTTYEAVARYQYQFEGQTYIGERVSLGTGADNIGSFHEDKHRELADFKARDRPFRCYVDPDNPSRSILYREMRWGLFTLMGLFGLVFAGVGFGLMAGGIWGKRALEEEENLTASFPDEPWRWKREWAEGRIAATGKTQFLLPAIMAVFWNLVSAPMLFIVPEEVLEKQNYLALIGLLFPLVGLGLLVWAGRALIRWKKFGDSVFEMSTVPGVVGGKLSGRILSSVDLNSSNGYLLKLDNINRVTTGSGDNRSTSERILWQDEIHLLEEAAQYDPSRSEIPVDFKIPFDTSPTEERGDDDEVLWRLHVEAEVPGVDYNAQFEVPVFKTGSSQPDPEESDIHIKAWGGPTELALQLADFGIDSELLSTGGQRLTFRAARHKGAALGLTAFLVLWLGFNALLVFLDAPIFFPIIWGIFSLLILLGTLDLWFERRTIDIHSDHLVLEGGILGLGRTREIQQSVVQSIEPVRGMQAGNQLFYRVQITTQDGKKHIAATKLDNLSLARHIVDLLVR